MEEKVNQLGERKPSLLIKEKSGRMTKVPDISEEGTLTEEYLPLKIKGFKKY